MSFFFFCLFSFFFFFLFFFCLFSFSYWAECLALRHKLVLQCASVHDGRLEGKMSFLFFSSFPIFFACLFQNIMFARLYLCAGFKTNKQMNKPKKTPTKKQTPPPPKTNKQQQQQQQQQQQKHTSLSACTCYSFSVTGYKEKLIGWFVA